ncbi:MAG: RNA-binding protein [Lachnospiraceae bacterium]|nr:RNA-binding protein [Lachnospiraceae bacterium]
MKTDFQIGKTEKLTILRETDFGAYLGKEGTEESVLLPKKQLPEGAKPGDTLTVFLYRDSEDRLIATTRMPKAQLGEFAYLKVKAATKIGAFLDWGLEKDLFVPFQEQEEQLKAGEEVLVRLYLDRSGRLSATTRIYHHLVPANRGEFRAEDAFEGVVYRTEKNYGVFVAVYPKEADPARMIFGLVPSSQVFRRCRLGEKVSGRVVRVRADGKLDLALRARDFEQIGADAETILKKMEEYGGMLPFSESAPPEVIRRELAMSKNGFKKALGSLLKAGKIRIGETEVTLLSGEEKKDGEI